MLGLWIALEDATLENGCLWFIPGSHTGEATCLSLVTCSHPPRLYTCVLSGSWFADSQPEPQGCMRPDMPPQKQALLPSNIWKCWKLLSQTFPQPLMRLATLQTVLYGRRTVCSHLWGHTLEEGISSLPRRSQFTSLVSADPSLWLQSSHFTSESKAGLTMEHSPSLLFFPLSK